MSDDDDYMSDKFLTGDADVRPSLINNRAKKRQIMVQTKQKENTKKQRDSSKAFSGLVDNQKLQDALSKPLESENKGFKLLEKMGYKPGQALGKAVENKDSTETGHQRLLEPIGITIKTDRQGLGRETAIRELMEKQIEIRKERLRKESAESTIEEFRRRTTQKAEDRFVTNALRRCQKTCENLDVQSQISSPEMYWFWPEKTKDPEDTDTTDIDKPPEESEEEEEDEFSNAEKLEMLTNYIRTSYNFCYWCGVRYEDVDDLNDNCPGLTKDDH